MKNIFTFGKVISAQHFLLIFMIITVFLFASSTGCQSAFAAAPSDVYATVDLSDRILDDLLSDAGIREVDEVEKIETDISPMHVYQLSVAVLEELIRYQEVTNVRPGFAVVAYPREYIPDDVLRLNDWILSEVIRTAGIVKRGAIPLDKGYFTNKKPIDVFNRLLKMFIKIRALGNLGDITPNEVFSQMERVVADIKAVLKTIDPYLRYRIDVLKSPDGLKPGDVFAECLSVRNSLNELREKFGMKTVAVPENYDKQMIKPVDVFIQTQILIAELNNIKFGTGTTTATPIAVPAEGKKPTDVHQNAALTKYLVNQVLHLQAMMKELSKNEDE